MNPRRVRAKLIQNANIQTPSTPELLSQNLEAGQSSYLNKPGGTDPGEHSSLQPGSPEVRPVPAADLPWGPDLQWCLWWGGVAGDSDGGESPVASCFRLQGCKVRTAGNQWGASWQALDSLGSWSDLEHDMSRNTGSGVSLRRNSH